MKHLRRLLRSRKTVYLVLLLIAVVAGTYVLDLSEQVRFETALVKSEGQLAEHKLELIRESREISASSSAQSVSNPGYEFSRPVDWRVTENRGSVILRPPFSAHKESSISVSPYHGVLEYYCMKKIPVEGLVAPKGGWEVLMFAASGECPAISVGENTRNVYVLTNESSSGKRWMIFAGYQKEEEERVLPVVQEIMTTFSILEQ